MFPTVPWQEWEGCRPTGDVLALTWGSHRSLRAGVGFHKRRSSAAGVSISQEKLKPYFYVNHQILKSWQRNPMFKTVCMQVKKKIDLLIPKVTPGLKLYDPYLFMTEEWSVRKTEN